MPAVKDMLPWLSSDYLISKQLPPGTGNRSDVSKAAGSHEKQQLGERGQRKELGDDYLHADHPTTSLLHTNYIEK